jgi:hypothetical protein
MSGRVEFIGRPALEVLTPREVREQSDDGSQLYKLREPFVCVSAAFGTITVPTFFVSNFASIPRAALWYIDDDSPEILFGSLVHDYIYAMEGVTPEREFTRKEADELLRDAMLSCGASRSHAAVVFAAVRTFGGSHWKS